MSAEISAPAHSDCGEDSDGVSVDPSGCHEVRNKSECCSYGSEGCDREGDEVRIGKSEEPFEKEAELASDPRTTLLIRVLICFMEAPMAYSFAANCALQTEMASRSACSLALVSSLLPGGTARQIHCAAAGGRAEAFFSKGETGTD